MGPDERTMFQYEENPAKIMTGMLQTFGTEQDQVPRKIEELKNLKKPKQDDHPHIQKNLLKLKHDLLWIIDVGQVTRLEAGVIRDIIPQAFDPELL